MDGDVRINPYLAGNFAPVRSEDDFDLNVTGEIPAGLRGALFRIGPNPQFEPLDPGGKQFLVFGVRYFSKKGIQTGKVLYIPG